MQQSYEEKVAALRERFLRNANERVASMAQLAEKAMAGNDAALSDLHRLLHDMVGNALMLSLEPIGLIARKGQEFVSGVEKNGRVGDLAGLSGILGELSDAIAGACDELGVDGAGAGSDGGAELRADDG